MLDETYGSGDVSICVDDYTARSNGHIGWAEGCGHFTHGIGQCIRVTFGLNVRLDLSGKATTKSLSSLGAELMLEVLSESTWTMAVWVIRGDEGVGDIPGVRGVSGESAEIPCNVARLTQELRLKV